METQRPVNECGRLPLDTGLYRGESIRSGILWCLVNSLNVTVEFRHFLR